VLANLMMEGIFPPDLKTGQGVPGGQGGIRIAIDFNRFAFRLAHAKR